MNKELYEKSQIIMMMCRIWEEQMEKCMKNAGLFDKKFHLSLTINPGFDDDRSYCQVMLSEFLTDVGKEQYEKTCMEQWKILGTEWRIGHDPVREKGTVPPDFSYSERRDFAERMGKEAEHPYPPDNMWISSRDDYPDVGVR